jgi:hypothetical protein
VFSIFKKKEKPKLFLGAIVVVPRNEIMKIDEWGLFKGENLEDSVRVKLEYLFSLPSVHEYSTFNDGDLALEIIVTKLQGGEFTSAQFSPIDIPIMWRPKVQIKARLFFINSKKTKRVFDVSQKMPWSQYFSRVFSFRGIIRFKPLFETVDLEPMLYKACEQLLGKLAKCA